MAAIGDFPFPADRTGTLWHPDDQCAVNGFPFGSERAVPPIVGKTRSLHALAIVAAAVCRFVDAPPVGRLRSPVSAHSLSVANQSSASVVEVRGYVSSPLTWTVKVTL